MRNDASKIPTFAPKDPGYWHVLPQTTVGRYFLAVALAMSGTGIQLLLQALVVKLDRAPIESFGSYQALLGAVVLSAIWCGRAPTMLCLALCSLFNLYFFVDPIYSLAINSPGVALQLALFIVVGLVVCFVGLERRQADDALRASDARTRLIVDSALDAVITMDARGSILGWNPQAEKTFGWTNQEALGRVLSEMIIPVALREAHSRGLERFLQTGKAIVLNRRLELVALRRDGQEFPIELAITTIKTGQDVSFSAFVRDITERKLAEEELRTNEARLRTLAESLPNLVWTCTADGWCDYLSRQWVEYTGQPAVEQLGAGWANNLHPEDRVKVQREWSMAVDHGQPYDIEFRIRRHDGAYRWFKTRAVPLRDNTGCVVKWFGSNTDIEDYKEAERKLLTQLERLALLDRTTRAIGSRLDPKSILQIVVHSLEEHLAIDFACVCFYDADHCKLTVTCVGARSIQIARQLALTESTQIEVDENELFRCVRGQLVYEPDLATVKLPFAQRLAGIGIGSIVVAPLMVENTVFGVLIAARHGPERFASGECEFLRQLSEHVALSIQHAQLYASVERAYEDLRSTQQSMMQHERLRALGQMASGIAHDINNALSPAALYTQSLREQEKNLSDAARDQLAVVQRAIEDVAHTVARMREFHRPRDAQLEPAAVNVERTLEQVIQLTRARWLDMPQERGIVIRLEREFAVLVPDIMGVESEIRDALTNLILNAVDAMQSGGTLTLRSRVTEKRATDAAANHGAHAVHIEVCDTGGGMDEHARARCLEPFFTTKGERGTGLGLAMVYGMVQRHHGDIEIDSVLGQGTTVRLIFYELAQPQVHGAVVEKNMPIRPLHILLVDDDLLVLDACRSVLERDGHTIVTAEGGRAGVETFERTLGGGPGFDIVMTDLGMPYVDGRQVASAVKRLAPQTPVILLTGWGHQLRSEQERPEYVDRVLSKPPKLLELRAALVELAATNRM